MANTKISALTANTNPNGNEEFVYAYNNANGKITLNTVKSFVGGAGITTLNADANIWELTDGTYETTYDLYYKSGETVPTSHATGVTRKQLLFVSTETSGKRGFFTYNVYYSSNAGYGMTDACFGYSASSADGSCFELAQKDWALKHYGYGLGGTMTDVDALTSYTLTQVLDNVQDNQPLRVTSGNDKVYPGVTYTIFVNSVASGQTYTMSLSTGVTNPLNIALPTSSNKKCVITLLATSNSTAIITGCTIAS